MMKQYFFHFGMVMNLYSIPVTEPFQSSDHIGRMVGLRENPLPALHLGFQARIIQQPNHIIVIEPGKRAVEKPAVGGYMA